MLTDDPRPVSPRQRLHLVLLGVDDVARSRDFYESLGWTRHERSHDGFVIFDLGGMALALLPRADLAADALEPTVESTGFAGMALVYLAASKDQVAAILAKAVDAGGTLVKPATVTPYGVAGYFRDPDGHLFEVDWEAVWEFDEVHQLVL